MVKRWGKSPPGRWQQGSHGKPHPEQCRIGASRGLVQGRKPTDTAAGNFQPGGPGWQLEPASNGGARGMVIHGGNPGTEPGLQAIRAFHMAPLARQGFFWRCARASQRIFVDKKWLGSDLLHFLSSNIRAAGTWRAAPDMECAAGAQYDRRDCRPVLPFRS
jgi:hypothetical protein